MSARDTTTGSASVLKFCYLVFIEMYDVHSSKNDATEKKAFKNEIALECG